MNTSLARRLSCALAFGASLVAGGCGTHSAIGSQTGKGGSGLDAGVSGTGGDNIGAGGSTGFGGDAFTGTGGSGFGGSGFGGDIFIGGGGGSTGVGGSGFGGDAFTGAGGSGFGGSGFGGDAFTGAGGSGFGGSGFGGDAFTGAGGMNTGAGGTGTGGSGSCLASTSSTGGVSFSVASEYFTNANSFLVAIGDLNGDGKPDLVTANYTGGSLGGTGGSSGAGGSFGTGGGSGSNGGSLSVFLSATSGFSAPKLYDVQATAQSIVTGDLNGDGKADVAIVDGQSVNVFFNDGTGKLLSPVSFAAGSGPVWLALGDLNGDGKADLAIANQGYFNGSQMVGGDVGVLLNMGGGTFVAANYPAGPSPVAVTMADLDGDGKSDLAVASGTGVSVLLNSGNGTFGTPATYGSGTSPSSVAAADLNGDGKVDLAVGRLGRASVLLNLGNGTFAAAVNYSYDIINGYGSLAQVVIGDLNGDGRPDLAAADWAQPCGKLVVLPNQGSGVFGAPSYFPASSPYSVTLGNLDGDGKLDLVVPNGDGVAVMLNTTP